MVTQRKLFFIPFGQKGEEIREKLGQLSVDYKTEYVGVELYYYDSNVASRVEEMEEKDLDDNMDLFDKKFQIMQEESTKKNIYLFADIIKLFIEPFEKTDIH